MHTLVFDTLSNGGLVSGIDIYHPGKSPRRPLELQEVKQQRRNITGSKRCLAPPGPFQIRVNLGRQRYLAPVAQDSCKNKGEGVFCLLAIRGIHPARKLHPSRGIGYSQQRSQLLCPNQTGVRQIEYQPGGPATQT